MDDTMRMTRRMSVLRTSQLFFQLIHRRHRRQRLHWSTCNERLHCKFDVVERDCCDASERRRSAAVGHRATDASLALRNNVVECALNVATIGPAY